MKKNLKNILFILLFLNINLQNSYIFPGPSPYIITFFIKSIDDSKKQAPKETVIKSMADTEQIVESILKPKTNMNVGVYATYAGYSAFSNLNGEITFTRKTSEDIINLLICDSIKPIYVNPLNLNTIYGFVPNPNSKTQFYSLQRKQDPETTLTSWYINQEETPIAQKISYNTILLFADPKNVILNTGVLSTVSGENLVLPDIYVTKEIGLTINALSFLKVRQYFAPVKINYNYKADQYQQRVSN